MARKTQQPIDISSLFDQQHSALAKIAEKQQALLQLQHIVSEICPDLPANGWKIANIKQNQLVIEVNNAIWSHRLQFEKNRILQQFQQQLALPISQIKITICPEQSNRYAKTPTAIKAAQNQPTFAKQTPIPAAVSEQLTDLARHAPKGLQQALLRLAKYKKP